MQSRLAIFDTFLAQIYVVAVLVDELDAARLIVFSWGALAVWLRIALAPTDGLDAAADSVEPAAPALVMRTPGRSPLVNSTPAASRCE